MLEAAVWNVKMAVLVLVVRLALLAFSVLGVVLLLVIAVRVLFSLRVLLVIVLFLVVCFLRFALLVALLFVFLLLDAVGVSCVSCLSLFLLS